MNKVDVNKLIRAKCLECTNYQLAEVHHCTVKVCPLWKHRLGVVTEGRKIVFT